MKSFILFVSIIALAINAQAQTIYPGFNDGQVYVKIKAQYPVGEFTGKEVSLAKTPLFNNLAQSFGIMRVQRPFYLKNAVGLGQIYRVYFTQYSKVDALIEELKKDATVEYAEKVPLMKLALTPTDMGTQSYSNGNWSLFKIKAQQAWDITTGNDTVKIAIIDNAVQTNHTDLAGNIWVNPGEVANNGTDDDNNGYIDDVSGFDVGDDDNNPNPPDTSWTHGTHCAGIASAKTNNGTGIAAIGYNCKILPVKATTNDMGAESLTNGFDGIIYAAAAGANVISLSWGGPDSSITEQELFDNMHILGITVCAAAGNGNSSDKFYPAAYNHVIAVASSGNNGPTDQKSASSNYGTWVDVSAPGDHIKSTVPFNNYGLKSGTSMATPLVAGLAGLLLSVNPTLTPDQLENCIRSTADNIDAANPTYIGQLGSGRINAYQAVLCAPLSVDESFQNNKVILYPNPAGTEVFIDATQLIQKNLSVRVYNSVGQTVAQQTDIKNSSGPVSIPLSGLNAGLYFVEVQAQGQRIVKKLVVE